MGTKETLKLSWFDFFYWKYISIRAKIRRRFHENETPMTTQMSFIVYNLNDRKLRERLNKEGYQFFPALTDQEVHLLAMDDWERVTKEEER